MNRRLYSPVFILAIGLLCSCSGSANKEESVDWKEMDEFHMVMADVFHPLKDSGNLDPIKARAEELAASAEKWAAAELPQKVDNDDVRTKLQDLKDGTRALADGVRSGVADADLEASLNELHDQFHALQEAWHHEGEHHKH